LNYCPLPLVSDPDSPLDPWRLARALDTLTHEDLFFSPGYNPPLYCAAPFIFTLHDLNHLDRQENSSHLKRLYYAMVVKRACHRAARILTVSEFSRGRIIDWSGVQPEMVVNVGCGVGPEYHPRAAPYPLPFPYILCVSNRRRHKNEIRQLQAFARSGLATEMRLVFTGHMSAELAEYIVHNRMLQSVHFIGLVPDAELPSLYRSAKALLFASLYEGFGLPVIEAMACGTPVVTSNITALPEIAGDAALLVDPTSVEQIATALRQIIEDSSLRQKLRAGGLARAAEFSWSRTTSRVRDLVTRLTSER
jgi:glycosyltransferase involved in cell wall biosynthesis